MRTIFTGWSYMRWFRLAAGLLIGIISIRLHDEIGGLIAAVFLFQAVTNTGCCGAGSYPSGETGKRKGDEIQFEEVKGPF